MSVAYKQLSAEQKRAALEQLLQSQTFARADQLRRFIRYVCEAEIAGKGEEIAEHTIATQALGRSADYVPGDDSSVRNRAHALRQKIDEYYRIENPAARIRIELRKGSYVPLFVERPPEAPPSEQPPTAPEIGPGTLRRRAVVFTLVAGALLGGATVGGVWAWNNWSHRLDPDLKAAWGTMLEPGADVTVCIAPPPTILLKSFRDGTLPPYPQLIEAPGPVQSWYTGLSMADGGGKLYMSTTMNSVLFGDSLAAARATRLLAAAGTNVRLLPEWGTRPLALRGNNLLLIGSPNYSPLAARILKKMPLTVWYDPSTREEVIAEDLADGKAPRRIFAPKRDAQGQYTFVYGLLTVLPSQAPDEGGEMTAIFSGITSAGPQSAMEFFASPSDLRGLKERMGRSNLPRAYQVIVRAGVDRSLALNWNYEHHRVVDRPPLID